MKKVDLTKYVYGRALNVRTPGLCNFNPSAGAPAHYRIAETFGTPRGFFALSKSGEKGFLK